MTDSNERVVDIVRSCGDAYRDLFLLNLQANMRLIILEDEDQVTEWVAKYVVKRIKQFNPGPDRPFVLGLPTGGTPLKMYKKLVEYYKAGKVSFKYVKTFNMDEYVNIARDHPESYHYYMFNNFFKVSSRSKVTFTVHSGLWDVVQPLLC